jgi:hypothetical protein
MMNTKDEELENAQRAVADAVAQLQRVRDKQGGVTRISRGVWDAYSDAQRTLLSDAITRGVLVITDDWPEEIEVTQ